MALVSSLPSTDLPAGILYLVYMTIMVTFRNLLKIVEIVWGVWPLEVKVHSIPFFTIITYFALVSSLPSTFLPAEMLFLVYITTMVAFRNLLKMVEIGWGVWPLEVKVHSTPLFTIIKDMALVSSLPSTVLPAGILYLFYMTTMVASRYLLKMVEIGWGVWLLEVKVHSTPLPIKSMALVSSLPSTVFTAGILYLFYMTTMVASRNLLKMVDIRWGVWPLEVKVHSTPFTNKKHYGSC